MGDPTIPMAHLIPPAFSAPICFLHGVWWSFELPGVAEDHAKRQAEHRRSRPQDRFISLCNTPAELPIARAAGLDALHAPRNAFIDEELFQPLPLELPEFNAVFNAAWMDFKRHHLASEIEHLALIGYYHRKHSDAEKAYRERLRAELVHATFCNEQPDGSDRFLQPHEINRILNRSRVGLCLSEAEGGNFASMEYMLSGLPVVSTPSKGGRDYFFDPDYCLIVPPDPRSIRDATMALAARAIPRSYIRAETLERVARERKRFIDFVQNLYDDAGVSRRFAQEWPSVFVHKMLRGHGVDEFWRDLSERLAAPDGAD